MMLSDGCDGGDGKLGPLPMPPRIIICLAANSRCFLFGGALFFLLSAVGSLFVFWPILVEEDFEAYLRCDGAMHANFEALHAAKNIAEATGKGSRRLLAEPRGLQMAERTFQRYNIKLIYATRDGSNIFTEKLLAQIRDFEYRLKTGLPSFNELCLADASGSCAPPLSVINFFYASQTEAGDIIPDGQGDNLLPIQAILANLGTSNAWFLDRYFGVSAAKLREELAGNITRTVFRFGLPLRGYSGPQDRPDEQEKRFRAFVTNELYSYLSTGSTDDLRVYFYGDFVTSYEVTVTVWHDARFAAGSLLFVFCYMVCHLRSLSLALSALFCIGLSFPLSYGIYCICVGHHRMIAINFLSLFVVLGVGADDVFVLNDVWKNAADLNTGELALARRMWQMYRKAGAAIFATSATTAASFFANTASSIGPLRQFGFFMGVCITMNWLVVATLYPLFLVVYERSSGGKQNVVRSDAEMQENLVVGGADEKMIQGAFGEEDCIIDERAFLDKPSVSPSPRIGRSAWAVLTSSMCLLGLVLPALALYFAVLELKPATGLPLFFPKESNLGALQDLQKRFGNETSISETNMRFCGGMLRTPAQCTEVENNPAPTLAPIGHLSGDVLHPVPHPSPAATPGNEVPQPPPTPALPATTAPAPAGHQEFSVKIEVKGHTKSEVEGKKVLFELFIRNKFKLRPGDVSISVEEQDDDDDDDDDESLEEERRQDKSFEEERRQDPMLEGRAVTFAEMSEAHADQDLTQEQLKDHWQKLLPAETGLIEPDMGVRRLKLKVKAEVYLHFHNLTPEQEQEVLQYMQDHAAEIAKLGGKPEPHLGPPASGHTSQHPATEPSMPTRRPPAPAATLAPTPPPTHAPTQAPTNPTAKPTSRPAPKSTPAHKPPSTPASTQGPTTAATPTSTAARTTPLATTLAPKAPSSTPASTAGPTSAGTTPATKRATITPTTKPTPATTPAPFSTQDTTQGPTSARTTPAPAITTPAPITATTAPKLGTTREAKTPAHTTKPPASTTPATRAATTATKPLRSVPTTGYPDSSTSPTSKPPPPSKTTAQSKDPATSTKKSPTPIKKPSPHGLKPPTPTNKPAPAHLATTDSVMPKVSVPGTAQPKPSNAGAGSMPGAGTAGSMPGAGTAGSNAGAGSMPGAGTAGSLPGAGTAGSNAGAGSMAGAKTTVKFTTKTMVATTTVLAATATTLAETRTTPARVSTPAPLPVMPARSPVSPSPPMDRAPMGPAPRPHPTPRPPAPTQNILPKPPPMPIHLPEAPPAALVTDAPVAVPVLIKRGMAFDRMSNIDVVWGVSPGTDNKDPSTLFNADFDLRAMAVQEAIVNFCERAIAEKKLKVWHAYSWPQSYVEWLRADGGEFPSPTFEEDLRRYYDVEPLTHDHMGWGEGSSNVLWVSVTFRVEFDSHSGAYQTLPFMNTWIDFVEKENKRVDDMGITSIGPAIVSAEIFVRAEAESRVINSALSSWLVSVGCALLAVICFTRNVFLSATATFAIFATAACSLYTITSVFKWHFGLMEAVSLIIFCGFSVDYPLHVVQAYVQERREGAGVREALKEVGFAVASGCITTVGAASFLCLCEIRIFRRFGQVLMANMIFALLFALLWIPALLEWKELTPCRSGTGKSASKKESNVDSGYAAPRVPHLDLAPTPLQSRSWPEGFEALGGEEAF